MLQAGLWQSGSDVAVMAYDVSNINKGLLWFKETALKNAMATVLQSVHKEIQAHPDKEIEQYYSVPLLDSIPSFVIIIRNPQAAAMTVLFMTKPTGTFFPASKLKDYERRFLFSRHTVASLQTLLHDFNTSAPHVFDSVHADLQLTTDIMRHNINTVLARGESIAGLVEKTTGLKTSSAKFQRTAKKLNSTCCALQ